MRTKRILDSVHGYIYIPEEWCTNIIDTRHFQRLRRIEQSSIRALYPSARHDRFIHSLGVYHLGCRILKALDENHDVEMEFPAIYKSMQNTYKAACLLHDVGHSPFSHTFENYFDDESETKLTSVLCELLNDEAFSLDVEHFSGTKPHECLSAIVSFKIYREFLYSQDVDMELLVRMIIGCPFNVKDTDSVEEKTAKSFKNCFIELIHGDIIDADRLDYVCRDVWASGYRTAQIDVERLIESIRIKKDDQGAYVVCFTDKAFEAIEAVLDVKDFQQKNVINHHTIVYDQDLLVKAMKSVCAKMFNEEGGTALRKLCNYECFFEPQKIGNTGMSLYNPVDDDFISLMKLYQEDALVKEFMGRCYSLFAVWKNSADLYFYLPELKDKTARTNFWNKLEEFYDSEMPFKLGDIECCVLKAKPKYSKDYRSNLFLYIQDKVIKYYDLMPSKSAADDERVEEPSSVNIQYYLYVPKTCTKEFVIDKLKALIN